MAQRALAEHERQTTFRTFLDSGLTNLANKEYDAAVVALDEALKLKPGDPEALAARQRAEKESAASRDAQARAEFQKKAEQYRKWMADGKTALFVTQDYEAAVAAFTQANQLFPTDRASAQLREQAEQARARQAAVEAPQPKGDARTRQRVRGLLAVALRAQSERDWKAAELALEEAWKLAPEDPAVRAALRDLEQQRLGADPEQERRWAAYYQVMRVGRDAVAAGGYPAAIRAFTEAIQLVQGDRDAVSLRLAAEKELAAAQVAYLTVQAAEKRLRQIVDDGYRALAANQVPTAMKALAVARELAPNHPLVAQLATAIENQRAAPAPKKVPEGPAFTLEVPQSVNLVAGGKTIGETALKLLKDLVDKDSEIVSLISGEDFAENEAAAIASEIEKAYPDLEVHVYDGGQPLYPLIMGVE